MKVNLCSITLLAVTICHATVFSTPLGKCPDYFDPDQPTFLPSSDCSKFYICSQSGPAEKNCPSGLHWNQNADVCDWPALAGCDPAATATTSATEPSTTRPAPAVTTSTTAAITVTSPPVTTTVASTTTAPASATTSSASPGVSTTTSPPATATAPSSTGVPNGQCPEENGSNNVVFLPHDDCSKYYVCTVLGPIEANCPAGLHWNQQKDVCDWSGAAGCVAAPSSTQTIRDQFDQCPEEYDPNNEVFLPNTSDCSKYYICTWGGVAVALNCPAGLHWNQNGEQCDWPAQAGCVQRNRDPLFKSQRLIHIPVL